MFLTYRYRLYPSKEQEEILSNWLEVCRQVWNWALQIRKTAYEEKRPFPTYLEIRIHHCSICGVILPRDHASALEILRRGVGPGRSELKPVETDVPTAGLPSVANRVWEAGISASG